MLIPFYIFILSQVQFHCFWSTYGGIDILSTNEKRLMKPCTVLINQITKFDALTSKDFPSNIMFCKINQSDSSSEHFLLFVFLHSVHGTWERND